MNKGIKVSVVVSVYNHDIKYLKPCIESLHNQTLNDGIEFIVIDNGATKESKLLLAEYENKDKRFKIIHFEKNLGYARALNTGIEMAQGSYIGIVESDDYVATDMYEKLYNQITKFKADVCIGGFYVVQNGIINNNINCKLIYENTSDLRLFSIMDYPFLFTCHPSIWCKLYKAEFLKQIKFNEKGRYIDSEFIVDLYCRTNRLIALKEPVYYYQCDNTNASQSNQRHDASLMDIIDDWQIAKESIKKYGFYEKLKDEFYYQSIKAAFRFYKNIHPKYRRKFFDKWVNFAKDLKNDDEFDFKYFNPEQKEFFECVLNNDYKRSLNYIVYNPTLLKNIFSVRNSNDKIYKIITILGINFKHKKKQKENIMLEFKKDILPKFKKRQDLYYYLQKSNIQAAAIHPKTFLPYKGIHTNKSVVVVGCGPTLQYYEPIETTIHVGVNRVFFNENLNLDYLFIQDYLKGENDMSLANSYHPNTCAKFYGILPENRYNQCKKVLKRINISDIISAKAKPYIIEDAVRRNWANLLEVEPIGDWTGCIFSALQFVLYTNPKKIYLVGCDCSKTGHFYEERGDVINGTDLSYQYKSWLELKEHLKRYYSDTEIITINPVGLKGMFKDLYTQSYVDEHPELLNDGVEIITPDKVIKSVNPNVLYFCDKA